MFEEAGTRLPADASILWGNEMDAYENRIPIHYIKGHTFWGGAVNLFVQHRLQHRQFGWIFYP